MPTRKTVLVLIIVAAVASILLIVTAVKVSEPLAWRARVLQAKVSGQLPEIPLIDLLKWMKGSSVVYLQPLVETPNVHSAITNRFVDEASGNLGKQVYEKSCVQCHGANAKGGTGPDLIVGVSKATDWAFFEVVKWGRAGTAMAAQPLSDLEIWQAQTYLRGLALSSAGVERASESTYKVNVAPGTILAAEAKPAEWLTYSGTLAGRRHSPLEQISKENVQSLRVAWVAQLRSRDISLQASPIVSGGLVFATESPDGVVALDAATGKMVWRHGRALPSNLSLCCGSPNRGVAILGDSVFVSTLDAHLIAIDASTGRKKWDVKVADHQSGYSMTGAPLAIGDRVVVGVAGGDFGARGLIAAYDPTDGKLLWKFNTIPGPGERGHETWQGDAWQRGGGPTWMTGSYDKDLDLVFWGVGNPAPVHQGDARPGDNLYSNSLVALDAKSGTLRWHYQFTPGDERDWDAVQQPVLADISWQGKTVPAILTANRNGFFYALDRASGKFLFAKPFVKQTWADGFDADGRPKQRPEARPSRTGTIVWPWVGGGTNWWSPSFDPGRKLFYIPAVDAASLYFRTEARFEKGSFYLASVASTVANQPTTASIKAVDPNTGDLRWETVLDRGGLETHRLVGGVLSLASGVLFAGYDDEFIAFDAETGAKLWQIRVGGRINAAPVTYEIGNQQHVAIMAGHSLFSFALPRSTK